MKTFRTLSQFNKSHSLLYLENGVLLWYHQTIQTDAIIFKGFPTTALYAIVKNCILLSLLKSRKCNILKILVDFWQIHISSFLQALRSKKFDVCIVNS